MADLTEEQAHALIRRMEKAGVPRERMNHVLEQAMHRARAGETPKMPPLGEYGPSGDLYPPGTGDVNAATQALGGQSAYDQYDALRGDMSAGKRLAMNAAIGLGTAGLVAGAGMVGNRLASLLPVANSMGRVSKLGAAARLLIPSMMEGGAQAAGEAVREKAVEGKVDPRRVGAAGSTVGLAGLGMRGIGMLGAVESGVPGKSTLAAVDDTRLMKGNRRGSWVDLRDDIRADNTVARQRELTTGRQDLVKHYEQFDNLNRKVDGIEMGIILDQEADRVRGPNADFVAARLRRHANRVMRRVAAINPNGKIGAQEYDEILREELTVPVYEGRGETEFRAHLEKARDKAAGYIYDRVTPHTGEASAAANLSSRQQKIREDVESIVGFADKDASGTKGIDALRLSLRSEKGVEAQRRMLAYDELRGKDYGRRLQELTYKDDWNVSDVAEIRALLELPEMGYWRQRFAPWFRNIGAEPGIRLTSGRYGGPIGSAARSGAVTASFALEPSHKPTGAKKEEKPR